MKKVFILSLVLALFSQVTAIAQEFNGRLFMSDVFRIEEHIKRQNFGIDFKDTDSYKGTPYNHPSFLNGNIYKGSELLATNVAIRYNAMADEIEVKESLASSDDDAKVLTKDPDIYVKIVNDIFVFVAYQGGIEGGGYFKVMQEGNKYDLFKKLAKEFVPEKEASSSITTAVPAKFVDKPIYYIVTKDGKFYELPKSRSKKLKVFGPNKDLIKKYVSSNGLDLNDEKDLQKVIKYYDTI